MIEEVIAEFGTIDVLINNACAPIRRTPFLEMDIEEWRQVFKVNLDGTFICSQVVAEVMKKNLKGKIINISSFAAYLPAVGFAAYSASKAGIELLSKTIAGELGQFGINVIFIRPGVIETEITKKWHEGEAGERMLKPIALKRFGDPKELADLVVFLASDKADYITGGPISIDGGKYVVQE
jgi:3-oxoacyl-[acyl-carrier protein] reductase